MPADQDRLIDSVPGILFRAACEKGWPMIYLSGGCLELTGHSSEELIGHPACSYSSLTHPEDLPRVMQALNDVVNGTAAYVIEYRLRTKAGAEKWVWEKGHGVFNESGEITAIEGFITDITPLKESEQELKLAKKKYEGIFQNATEGIFQTSADGTYLSVNPALAHIYGYDTPEEMMSGLTDIGRQLYVDERRRVQFIHILERRQVVVKFESQIRRRDGTIIWISENARVVRDERGALLYYEGSVIDITARKRAEDALEKERNMLRTLIDHWPDHIYVRNRDGKYLLSNMAHTQSLDMTSPAEVEGKGARDFFVPERARQFTAEDMDLMERGASVLDREEVREVGSGRERWVLTTKVPLRNRDGEILGLVGITRDISAHKRLEDQLRHSQKMEAVGTLAGGIAHDFNNILTAILGYSEMIVARSAHDDVVHRDAEEIYAGGLRAAALTQQLLAFSRKQIVEPRLLNVNSILEGLEHMVRRLIGENVQFTCKLDRSIGAVRADAGQFEQVIINLVVNARDAMPGGGSLVLTTANVVLDDDYTEQHAGVQPGAYVRIAISDTGTGIPPEILSRIFEPFFTTKDQGKGTGLGLATSYGIVTQNGGHIGVYSEFGRGTTFNVYLPLADGGASQDEAPAPALMPRGTETVLLVEDDEGVRKLTRSSLLNLGYRILEAGNGHEALTLIQQQDSLRIDLLLTDVVMPQVGGKRLADHMEIISPHTKILFTSGYNEEAVLLQGILEREVAFLQKPYSLAVLADKVRAVLND